jgi:hypothetical protein
MKMHILRYNRGRMYCGKSTREAFPDFVASDAWTVACFPADRYCSECLAAYLRERRTSRSKIWKEMR